VASAPKAQLLPVNGQAAAFDRQTLIGHGPTLKQVRYCYSSIDQRALGGEGRYDILVELSSTSKRESSSQIFGSLSRGTSGHSRVIEELPNLSGSFVSPRCCVISDNKAHPGSSQPLRRLGVPGKVAAPDCPESWQIVGKWVCERDSQEGER
jgi:hypothetical protein